MTGRWVRHGAGDGGTGAAGDSPVPPCQPRHRRVPPAAGFQQIYLEPLLKFHHSLKKLRLHEAEYVLLQAMLLFSPGKAPGGG